MKKSKSFFAVCILTSAICHLTSYIAFSQYTKLFDFTGLSDGGKPYCSLISDGTFLYGMTRQGGTNDSGAIFKIKPDGTGYTTLLNLSSTANGANPYGSLVSVSTSLYGMTYRGGTSNKGVLFKINPDGTGFSKLHDFIGFPTDGNHPNGSLIYDGTYLYGMTSTGGSAGSFGYGTIFKIKPDGSGYSVLFNFTGTANGRYPEGDLIYDGTYLYGMTSMGGANDLGAIFKIKPDGTGYLNIMEFNTTNGSYPNGSLIADNSFTFLYGMTASGGTSSGGVIFKIKSDGTGAVTLLNFDGTNGYAPWGSLLFDNSFSLLYGMTSQGGFLSDSGIVFKIKPDGTGYFNMLDLNGVNGSNPQASLFSDGSFLYGTTTTGGINYLGTIFKLDINTSITENNAEKDFAIYPNPGNGMFNFQWLMANVNTSTIEIYNVMGECIHRQIAKSANQQIDLSAAPNGIYFLHVTTGQETATKKLIIRK